MITRDDDALYISANIGRPGTRFGILEWVSFALLVEHHPSSASKARKLRRWQKYQGFSKVGSFQAVMREAHKEHRISLWPGDEEER